MQTAAERIGTLIQKEPAGERRDKLVKAEQDAIGFYFDMLKAINRLNLLGTTEWPDAAPMKDAVRVINKACAANREPLLFGTDKNIHDMADLYEFAGQVAA